MPRITVVTNRCNTCGATHRPTSEDDDSDRLEDGVEDTELPEFWISGVFRAKQPNPEYARSERKVRKVVEAQWAMASQQAAQAKGAALDSADIAELKEFLEKQARGDEEYPELVVTEVEVLWCPNCTPRLASVGLLLTELSAGKSIPSAWAPAAPPAVPTVAPVQVPPPVVATPVVQPSAPSLAIVPGPAPATTTTPEPPAPRAA